MICLGRKATAVRMKMRVLSFPNVSPPGMEVWMFSEAFPLVLLPGHNFQFIGAGSKEWISVGFAHNRDVPVPRQFFHEQISKTGLHSLQRWHPSPQFLVYLVLHEEPHIET